MGSNKRAGAKAKELTKPKKKKVSILTQEHIEYVDWKDVNLLRKFMSERAKIRARRVTGNDAQQQKEVSRAIKNAREMALLPYTNRITTQRGSKSRARDQEDRPENEGEGDAETAIEYEGYSEDQEVELASEEVEV